MFFQFIFFFSNLFLLGLIRQLERWFWFLTWRVSFQARCYLGRALLLRSAPSLPRSQACISAALAFFSELNGNILVTNSLMEGSHTSTRMQACVHHHQLLAEGSNLRLRLRVKRKSILLLKSDAFPFKSDDELFICALGTCFSRTAAHNSCADSLLSDVDSAPGSRVLEDCLIQQPPESGRRITLQLPVAEPHPMVGCALGRGQK